MYTKLKPPNLADYLKGYMLDNEMTQEYLGEVIHSDTPLRSACDKLKWLEDFLEDPWELSPFGLEYVASITGFPIEILGAVQQKSFDVMATHHRYYKRRVNVH